MRRVPRRAPLAAALLLAAGCRADGPEPTAMVPDHGPAGAPIRVVVHGRGFLPAVATDFAHPEDDRLDGRFTLTLDGLPMGDVQLRPDGALDALVPAGLAPGAHGLTVVRPDGRRGSLGAAYRAIAPGAGDDVVAGFRVEVPAEATAGTSFEVTVVALDAQGAPAADFGGAVELSDRTGTLVPQRVGLFDRGRWTGLVEVRASSPADVLTARVPGGASGDSASLVVHPAPETALAFAPPVAELTAGGCSGALALALLDRFGEETAASAALAVALAPAPDMALFADAGCTVPLAPALQPFSTALTFHLRASAAGPFTVSASADGLAGATLAGEVLPAAPAQLVLQAPASALAGQCTAASVEVRDALGNAALALGLPIAIEAAPQAGLALYADAGCAVPLTAARPGSDGRASFAFVADVAWPVTLTAAAAGLPPASQEVVVAPAAVAQIAFAPPPRRAQAGRCSPALTVFAQDRLGNAARPSSAVAVALSVTPAGPPIFADPDCRSPLGPAALAPGSGALDLYLLAPAAGTYLVNASAPPYGGAAQDLEVAQ